jgi:hypothetical protein
VAVEDGCAAARPFLDARRDAVAKHDARCALRAGARARSLCPTLTDPPAEALAREADALRTAHGPLSLDGPWLVEHAPDESRVWDVSSGSAKLRARVEGYDLSVLPSGLARAAIGDDVAFVDPRTGSIARVPWREIVAETTDLVFAAKGSEVRRLVLPKLEPDAVVTWGSPSREVGLVTPLAGGAVLVVGDTLVSFEAKAVVRTDLPFLATSADETHVLGCDPKAHALVDVAPKTGGELGRVALPSGADCPQAVGFARDPRFVFWLERGPETKDAGAEVVVVAGDLRSGQLSRFADPGVTWSIALRTEPFLEEGSARLCARFVSFHGSWTHCGWKLDARGRLSKDARPSDSPTSPRVGPGGIIELGMRALPKADLRLVLSFKEDGEAKSNLRLGVFRGPKLERSISLEPGSFFFDDMALKEAWRAHEYPELPSIWPLDEHHVVVSRGTGSLTDMVVDVDTGAVTRPCKDQEDCSVVGRYAVHAKDGELVDVLTGAKTQLGATASEWAATPHVEAPCP